MKAVALKRIIDEYAGPPEGLCEHLAMALGRCEGIRAQLRAQATIRGRCEAQHKANLLEVEKAIEAIRKDCKHWSITQHGQSYASCDICGEVFDTSPYCGYDG